MAAINSPIANACDIVTNYHARKTIAVPEGYIPNADDWFSVIGKGNCQRSGDCLFTISDGNGVAADFVCQMISW
jgi:hypothetical protein